MNLNTRVRVFSNAICGCALALGFIATTGCDSGPTMVPISGVVNIDGKPLETGTVTIWVKGHRPAYGMIGNDGRFQLMTHKPGDGCVPGQHAVSVSSQIGLKNDATQIFAPERYCDPERSGISIVVDQPKDDWVIDLTWKGDPHSGPYIVK